MNPMVWGSHILRHLQVEKGTLFRKVWGQGPRIFMGNSSETMVRYVDTVLKLYGLTMTKHFYSIFIGDRIGMYYLDQPILDG